MKIIVISFLLSCLSVVLSSSYYSVLSGTDGNAISTSALATRPYKTIPIKTYVYSDGSPISSTSLGKSAISDYSLGYGVGSGVGSGLGSGLSTGLDKSVKSEVGSTSLLAQSASNSAQSASLRGPHFFGRGYPYDRLDPYEPYDDYDPYRSPYGRSPRLSQSSYHLGYKLGHGVGYGLGYGLGQGIGKGLNTGLDGGSGDDNGGGGGGGGGRGRGGRSGKLKDESNKPNNKEEEETKEEEKE